MLYDYILNKAANFSHLFNDLTMIFFFDQLLPLDVAPSRVSTHSSKEENVTMASEMNGNAPLYIPKNLP